LGLVVPLLGDSLEISSYIYIDIQKLWSADQLRAVPVSKLLMVAAYFLHELSCQEVLLNCSMGHKPAHLAISMACNNAEVVCRTSIPHEPLLLAPDGCPFSAVSVYIDHCILLFEGELQ
jgi:hypothetical protein